MKLQLEAIRSEDPRSSTQLEKGEVVEHRVVIGVDGSSRTFSVFLQANVLPSFDASLIYGDPLLEELLRFEPRALSALYHSVGKYRRGVPPSLPLVLVDSDDVADFELAEAPTA
jgi:hypothetical protein